MNNQQVRKINLSFKRAPCPRCGSVSKRHSVGDRRLSEIGISKPTVLEVKVSKHFCNKCRKHFTVDANHIAQPSCRYTNRVRRTAVNLVQSESLTLEKAAHKMRQKYHVRIPSTTLHDWLVAELPQA